MKRTPPAPLYVMFCGCSKPMTLADMKRLGFRIVCTACWRARTPSAQCRVETFRDDLTRRWGWQCSCGEEGDGYRTLAAAEIPGLAHEAEFGGAA